MVDRDKYIRDKIKGSIAEELALQLFLDTNCQVYRTGHEFLYPQLFRIANNKRNKHAERVKQKDLQLFKNDIESIAHQKVADLRYSSSITGKSISSNPDFVIITPTGELMSFEVKYRFDGNLINEEKEKYLRLIPSPYILIIMGKQPFIKVLYPSISLVVDTRVMIENIKKQEFNPENYCLEKNDKEVLKELEHHTERIDLIKIDNKDEYFKTKLIYNEQMRADSGDLLIKNSFFNEYYIIKKGILQMYEKIIEETYTGLNGLKYNKKE